MLTRSRYHSNVEAIKKFYDDIKVTVDGAGPASGQAYAPSPLPPPMPLPSPPSPALARVPQSDALCAATFKDNVARVQKEIFKGIDDLKYGPGSSSRH